MGGCEFLNTRRVVQVMKRAMLYIVTVLLVGAGLFSGTAAHAAPTTTTKDCPGGWVLLFPPWYKGLKCDVTTDGTDAAGKENITAQTVKIDDIKQIWIIVMNIVQWLIVAGGYVSLYFIIWSGFKYITAAGDPQKVTAAKNTITNAVIGLVIVLASVAIVQTIQAGIKGVVQ